MEGVPNLDNFPIEREHSCSLTGNLKGGIVAKFDCAVALRTICFKCHNIWKHHVCGARVGTAVMGWISWIGSKDAGR